MERKSKVFLAIFATVVLIFIITVTKWTVKRERDLTINFKVTRVEITPAFRAVFYDKNNNRLRLQRFVFYDYHDILPGDLIKKEKGDDFLYVYRFDSMGNNKLFLTMPLE